MESTQPHANWRSKSTCETGLDGACNGGRTSCVNGAFDCLQEIQPSAETCDNLDNNCDGNVDEDLSQECYTGPGRP